MNKLEEDWTPTDTNDLMDIMELSLTRVRRGITRRLRGLQGRRRRGGSQGDLASSQESLDRFVSDTQACTVEVVEEISKGISQRCQ